MQSNQVSESVNMQPINHPEYDEDGNRANRLRVLKGAVGLIISVIAIFMSFFHLYTAMFGVFESILQRSAHLGFALILVFAIYKPASRAAKSDSIPWYDWILIALSAGTYAYFVLNAQDISSRMTYIEDLSALQIAIGVIAALVLVEATRRVVGTALLVIIILFLLYGLWGQYLPGALGHRGFDLMWIIDHLFYTTSGVFSTPLGVSATFIFLFILFGKFLEVSGAGQFFIDLSVAGMGKYRGGPAKTAVVASGIMGMISGSAVANTVTTGAFTIPLMKKTGYKSHFAGAVESVASSGGQITPPIMGAAAFIIATYLGIPYVELAYAAAIPALLFYISLFMQVDFRAKRIGLRGINKEELPRVSDVFKKGYIFFVPLIVIIVMLVSGASPMRAGLFAIGATIFVALINRVASLDFKTVVKALDLGARASLETAVACAAAGLIIGVIGFTGIGLQFSSLIISMSGGILIIALIFTMITSIILGMGLPTVAAYIVQVPLTIPALIELGVSPLAAHMFVFYFAAMSAITPPVALAAFAAAGIAGSEPMKTGLTAVRLGIAAFIVPFIFVYGEALLLMGNPLEVILATITAIIGIMGIASAAEGWLLRHSFWYERLILTFGSLLMIVPGIWTDLIGIAILSGIYLNQRYLRKDLLPES
ncbi:C4-dicarboxylate ABC transporter [Compostibacillus humi]|uniref:C4-dicarboxylate ABC transporter n=1 Tax=Compostibacillus humi TaxID=1245525 RepID=A0A8J2ZNM8_9BACI|nr:TRAP transporter permease [Compostibacillus humi]GGH67893.1 C4-dicarboxylate ABC transporter [Compostibacillus humi]